MNKKRPEISIIVPVYNVERYLSECLDSILEQTFIDYEVIHVDDGSTDDSGRICDKYTQQDDRIMVIHQENKGISGARNAGLDKAVGRYISFIDSDDYVEADYLEQLHFMIKEYNADVSMCGHYEVTKNFSFEPVINPKVFITDTQGAIKVAMEAKITGVNVYDKLYKSELIDGIRFPIGKYCEDTFFTIKVIARCTKAAITEEKKYFYRHRSTSFSNVEYSKHDLDAIEADQQNYELIAEKYPDILDVAEMRRCWGRMIILQKEILSSKRDDSLERELISFLRDKYLFIMRNKMFTHSRKIAATALMINKELYRLCAKIYQRKQEKDQF